MIRVDVVARDVAGVDYWCEEGMGDEPFMCARKARTIFGLQFVTGDRARFEASRRELKDGVRVRVESEHAAWVNGRRIRTGTEGGESLMAITWAAWRQVQLARWLGETFYVRATRLARRR